jgi:hypothetical protein
MIARTARLALIRPPVETTHGQRVVAVERRDDVDGAEDVSLICWGVARGLAAAMRATRPVTAGAAIEVPDSGLIPVRISVTYSGRSSVA